MTFPELIDVSLRTDESFRGKVHKNHHKGTSALYALYAPRTSGGFQATVDDLDWRLEQKTFQA
jgi:hypothetical protein